MLPLSQGVAVHLADCPEDILLLLALVHMILRPTDAAAVMVLLFPRHVRRRQHGHRYLLLSHNNEHHPRLEVAQAADGANASGETYRREMISLYNNGFAEKQVMHWRCIMLVPVLAARYE